MLFVGKGKEKKFVSTKVQRVTHLMINCFESNFVPLNPLEYEWEKKDDGWSPLWFDGPPLPSLDNVEEDENVEDETVGLKSQRMIVARRNIHYQMKTYQIVTAILTGER